MRRTGDTSWRSSVPETVSDVRRLDRCYEGLELGTGCQYLGMMGWGGAGWARRVDVEIVALLADVLETTCHDTRGAISFRALIER